MGLGALYPGLKRRGREVYNFNLGVKVGVKELRMNGAVLPVFHMPSLF
jgi:hypothetical protein